MARFLVVDDDPSTVDGVTKLLTYDGHEVSPFTAGADAVDALSRESFDAVMTDLEMPHVDGHAIVQVARERQPEACLVVVTAAANEQREALIHGGACIVADKPVDFDEVTKAVTDCRARGGPGAHGRCHMRSRDHHHDPVRLRRK